MRPDLEFEVPPASVCARCGSPICDGCPAHPPSPTSSPIAWEASGSFAWRLWSTARASALTPELVFGKLQDGPVLVACSFALFVELCALGSLALVALGLGFLVAPDVARALASMVASDGPLAFAVAASVPALAGIMVGLHALWGITLELGAKLTGADWRFGRGLRFAFYSCGWDLLTSPAGLAFGFVSGGAARAWRETVSAARVPRAAMDAYLSLSRKLSPTHVARARRLAVLLTAGPIVVAVVAMIWLTVLAIAPG